MNIKTTKQVVSWHLNSLWLDGVTDTWYVFSLIPYGGQEVACHLLIPCFAGERVEERGKLLL